MRFGSTLAEGPKLDRAVVLALALAELAVRGGERVGLVGLTRPVASRDVIDRFAEVLAVAEVVAGGCRCRPPRRSRRAPDWC